MDVGKVGKRGYCDAEPTFSLLQASSSRMQ